MKEERIVISIDRDGRIIADAHGFSGEKCMKEIEKLLEGMPEAEEVEKKPDFYKRDAKVATRTKAKY